MLRVIIVGAGIAGLAAAISLRRAGHCVYIYERSAMLDEIGAAVHVPPNVTRFLVAWGLDPARWHFVKNRRMEFVSPLTLKTIQVLLQDGTAVSLGGAELYHAHRVDLHKALKWMATRPDGPGSPVTIYTMAKVVAYDPVIPSITLKNGESISGHLLVAADGIYSTAASVIQGYEIEPVLSLYSNYCYRFLIPTSVLEQDPETRSFTDGYEGWTRIYPDNENNKRLIAYPCRDNALYNFVAIFYDKCDTTNQAQGSAQALEDGLALGIVMCGASSRDDVEKRLEIYGNVRRARTSVIQILSHAGQDQARLIHEELRKYLPEDEIPTGPATILKNNYGFDALHTTLTAMTEYSPSFTLPLNFFQPKDID
ncbi:hypothetical protein NLG97_g5607 [Lecanicillium saksenae]|uniref:Uncharacterized protein n=1 Tax=Lecanicillium saksenae TaxID=468837 RepID=A0ACC1QTB4_9HYPO|nr:hypothetical protein NLG97_g5607 [Lecanicillium saksenae]